MSLHTFIYSETHWTPPPSRVLEGDKGIDVRSTGTASCNDRRVNNWKILWEKSTVSSTSFAVPLFTAILNTVDCHEIIWHQWLNVCKAKLDTMCERLILSKHNINTNLHKASKLAIHTAWFQSPLKDATYSPPSWPEQHWRGLRICNLPVNL